MNREKFFYLKVVRGLPKTEIFNESQICFEYIDLEPEVKLENGQKKISLFFKKSDILRKWLEIY